MTSEGATPIWPDHLITSSHSVHRSGRMTGRPSRSRLLLRRTLVALLSLTASFVHAQGVTERVLDEQGNPREVEQRWSHVGLLRARDLTPFGLLRLDMLPAHTADAAA